MKRFRLSGVIFKVDDEDEDLVKSHKWYTAEQPNGIYIIRLSDGKTYYLHREIMHVGDDRVDHKDRDTLNNCRSNLRVCTPSQNTTNSRKRLVSNSSSRFKGVSKHAAGSRYRASVRKDNIIKRAHFDTEEEAARWYDIQAIQLHGEFACTNEMLGFYDSL